MAGDTACEAVVKSLLQVVWKTGIVTGKDLPS